MAKRSRSKPSKNRRSGRKTQNKSYGTSIVTKIFASFLGAIFSLLGLGVTYVLIGPIVVSSLANNDYGFFIGALVIAGVAISGVRASRSGLRLRSGSSTFGKAVARKLNAASGELLWVPPGFAHGYLVLSDRADIVYLF